MIAALTLCALVAFPGAPLADQVALGREIARTEPRLKLADLFGASEPRASFDRVWGEEKRTVGWWSNGSWKQPVEHVVWLSPALLSRWLGFLEAREYWELGELAARWAAIAAEFGDRRLFVVQLTAYPKLPTFGIGDVERTTPEEIENVRFVYSAGVKSQRMDAVRIAQWQSRERGELQGFPWWQHVSFGRALTGEFERDPVDEPLPLGDNYRAWYLVSVSGVEDAQFEVRVLSRRKERVASFGRRRDP